MLCQELQEGEGGTRVHLHVQEQVNELEKCELSRAVPHSLQTPVQIPLLPSDLAPCKGPSQKLTKVNPGPSTHVGDLDEAPGLLQTGPATPLLSFEQ